MNNYQKLFAFMAAVCALIAYMSKGADGTWLFGTFAVLWALVLVISLWKSRPRWPKQLD